jgi:hypothetical protein
MKKIITLLIAGFFLLIPGIARAQEETPTPYGISLPTQDTRPICTSTPFVTPTSAFPIGLIPTMALGTQDPISTQTVTPTITPTGTPTATAMPNGVNMLYSYPINMEKPTGVWNVDMTATYQQTQQLIAIVWQYSGSGTLKRMQDKFSNPGSNQWGDTSDSGTSGYKCYSNYYNLPGAATPQLVCSMVAPGSTFVGTPTTGYMFNQISEPLDYNKAGWQCYGSNQSNLNCGGTVYHYTYGPAPTPTVTPTAISDCRAPTDDSIFPGGDIITITPGACYEIVPTVSISLSWLSSAVEIVAPGYGERIPEILGWQGLTICVDWVSTSLKLMGISLMQIIDMAGAMMFAIGIYGEIKS